MRPANWAFDGTREGSGRKKQEFSRRALHRHDFAAVFAQPFFGLAPGGTDFFNFGPKTIRVIHLPQMHQLVKDDVINDEGRRLDEAPVERDRAATRTRA